MQMAPTTHTFLFADLVGFTTLTSERGDEAAADLAISFAQRISWLAGDHRARVIKSIGDAVMVRGEDPADAILLGMRIVEDVDAGDGFPPVRVGMHTGPAAERGGDWFGSTVNLAARVAASARGGEVLVTQATRAATESLLDVRLHRVGPRGFKNVLAPILVYLARRPAAYTLQRPAFAGPVPDRCASLAGM